jgi:hypothetical protein
MTRKLTLVAAVLLACHRAGTPASVDTVDGPMGQPAGDPGRQEDDFPSFAAQFTKAWDARDLSALDALVPKDGLWLIYNVGVAPYPYRYASVTSVVQESQEKNFGHAHFIRFACDPKPGPGPDLWNCIGDGEEHFSVCRYGTAKPILHKAFDFYLKMGISPNDHEERAWADRAREQALAFEKAELRFLSDTAWGAVFYFVKAAEWQLVALSTTDCSA